MTGACASRNPRTLPPAETPRPSPDCLVADQRLARYQDPAARAPLLAYYQADPSRGVNDVLYIRSCFRHLLEQLPPGTWREPPPGRR